ncbi:MAG TPA: M23 family metallopeptidase [Gemmatimonadales bacterium]
MRTDRRGSGFWRVAVAVLAAGAAGCEAIERIPDLFDRGTPRERYEASLERAGLTGTALVKDWRAAAERALREAPVVTSPHVEEGYFPPAEPNALAFRVAARRGQEIAFELQLVGDTSTLVFVDAWQAEGDTARTLRPVAEADSGLRALTFSPRRDGDFVLRVQPELLSGGRFRITVDIRPTLAFPVRGGRDRDIKSGFGAPRDGGARSHHGIDIFARRGALAVAAGEAVVTRVETTARGGNVVWLRDRRGFSLYYAHLDSQYVEEGAQVFPGDTIGFVGNTGNAITAPPHLHFGIYRRGEGPVDPYWFVYRPGGTVPRLVADTVLLGAWARTPKDGTELHAAPAAKAPALLTLPRHTPMRVLSAVGSWYRVRLPDGLTGYLAARLLEPANRAVRIAELDQAQLVLSQPYLPSGPHDVVSEVAPGVPLAVLGRFGGYLFVRTPAGQAGWMAE